MVHQPPDPFVAPRGVVAYVAKIAEAAGLPVVLYLRNDGIGLPAIEALCKVPGVVGVKWATPNVMVLAQAIRRAGPEVSFICGLAEPWAPPMTALGARGFTSGLINLVPEKSVAILQALRAGDFARANAGIAAIAAFEALRVRGAERRQRRGGEGGADAVRHRCRRRPRRRPPGRCRRVRPPRCATCWRAGGCCSAPPPPSSPTRRFRRFLPSAIAVSTIGAAQDRPRREGDSP